MGDDKTSLELYKKAHAAADKFDYFVCAVTGAIFGYEAERFSPNRMALDFHLLELISILLLAASFWFGLEKLRYSVRWTYINRDLNDSDEKSLLIGNELKDDKAAERPKYGEALRDVMSQKFSDHRIKSEFLAAQLQKVEAVGSRWEVARDILLIAGFLAIVAARILQPYGADSSAHAAATAQPSHLELTTTHSLAIPASIQLPPAQAPTQAATNKTSK